MEKLPRYVETSKASVQCHISTSTPSTADAPVQNDHYDLTSELRQQILNLSEVVKQLTALKCLHQHEPETASLPLFDDDLPTLDSEADASLTSFKSSPPVQTYHETATSGKEPTESQRPVLRTLHEIHQESLSPVFPAQTAPTRSLLQPVDQNVTD